MPKNALVKQYQRMFELDGVELEFEERGARGDRRPGRAAQDRCPRTPRDPGRRARPDHVRDPAATTSPGSSSPGAVLENAAPTMIAHDEVKRRKSA